MLVENSLLHHISRNKVSPSYPLGHSSIQYRVIGILNLTIFSGIHLLAKIVVNFERQPQVNL